MTKESVGRQPMAPLGEPDPERGDLLLDFFELPIQDPLVLGVPGVFEPPTNLPRVQFKPLDLRNGIGFGIVNSTHAGHLMDSKPCNHFILYRIRAGAIEKSFTKAIGHPGRVT